MIKKEQNQTKPKLVVGLIGSFLLIRYVTPNCFNFLLKRLPFNIVKIIATWKVRKRTSPFQRLILIVEKAQ